MIYPGYWGNRRQEAMGRNYSEVVVASQDAYLVLLGNFSLWHSLLQKMILPPLFWKIVVESKADIMWLRDCLTEILHASKEVVKLCSRLSVPKSGDADDDDEELKTPAMLLATCLLVLAICLHCNCLGCMLWFFCFMSNSQEGRISLSPGLTNFFHGKSLEWWHKVFLVTDESYNDASNHCC